MRHFLFKLAHAVKSKYSTFAEALKYAWKVVKLKSKMTTQVVSFKFKKVDGSIRQALGTLRPDYLPSSTGKRGSKDTVLTYFDLERQEYRCTKIENLIFN